MSFVSIREDFSMNDWESYINDRFKSKKKSASTETKLEAELSELLVVGVNCEGDGRRILDGEGNWDEVDGNISDWKTNSSSILWFNWGTASRDWKSLMSAINVFNPFFLSSIVCPWQTNRWKNAT